ncbi:tripartite tricarboxylate transporter TctB family protein [Methylopila turkensis]|uniref:DUF1468 domain-containing protein n=1 Tax=Methylopila turkensis TaxID=1437816 RepID=A0A9W6JPR7_9HYPH|nr:tripartite tricarboxylate transporter TctB family protein [Methylopila turkensis]GLK79760.1 hypothetical protein GCM10008174_15010 [Methylopila turkensis]
MTTRFDLQDALFGAFLVAVAALTFYATRTLTFGSPADMGPGFMPRVLAGIAMAFGLFFVARGLSRGGEAIERPHLRPFAAVLGAIAVFALLGVKAGLAVAALAAVLVAAAGSDETRPVEAVLFAVALAVASVLLFVTALALPIPAWPW